MIGVRTKKSMVVWTPKTGTSNELAGSAHLVLVAVMTALFVSGGCYLYSVNQNAVQGYHMRTLEKEIALLEQKNAELRIAEADLRSLHHIEAVTMQELEIQKLDTVKYREEPAAVPPPATNPNGPVAFR